MALQKKGLQAEMDEVKKLLAAFEVQPKVTAPIAPIGPEEIEKLAKERLAGYERLNLWYTDWAEVSRTELSHHQLARLGLVKVGGAGATGEEPTE